MQRGFCHGLLEFEELPISVADAERGGRLTGPHRDPFDRMVIARALANARALVSNETMFGRQFVIGPL